MKSSAENVNFYDFCGEYKLDFSSVTDEGSKKFLNDLSTQSLDNFFKNQKNDKNLDQMAIHIAYAFSKNLLTSDQVITLLDLRAMVNEFPSVGLIPMFDNKNQLTQQAIQFLPEFLSSKYHENFAEKMLSLPLSERYFIRLKDKDEIDSVQNLINLSNNLKIILDNTPKPLDRGNFINKTSENIPSEKKEIEPPALILITLTAGARQILTSIRYGKNTKSLYPKLGILSINDIEKSIRKNGRYYAISYPGINNSGTFHKIKAKSFYLSLHDELHRQFISSIPNSSYETLLSAIDMVREKTGLQWSKELWDCMDMEFISFINFSHNRRDNDSTKALTEGFLKLLDENVFSEKRAVGLFTSSAFIETTWLLIIDFVKRPDFWLKKGIDPDYFQENSTYSNLYKFVFHNKSKIFKESRSAAAEVLTCMELYFGMTPSLEEKESDVSFKKTNARYIQLFRGEKTCFLDKNLDLFTNETLRPYLEIEQPMSDRKKFTELSREKLNLLKENIFDLFTDKFISIDQLALLPTQTIAKLEKKAIAKLFKLRLLSLEEITDLSDRTIERLQKNTILEIFKSGEYSIDELANLSDERLEKLEKKFKQVILNMEQNSANNVIINKEPIVEEIDESSEKNNEEKIIENTEKKEILLPFFCKNPSPTETISSEIKLEIKFSSKG